jgi:autotransporter-associated beta strand protein
MKSKSILLSKHLFQSACDLPRFVFMAFLMPALTPVASAVTETFNTPGTIDWVCPDGVTSLTVETRGGGGAGGSATRSGAAGSATSGGGAGGSYAKKVITAPPANAIYKVTVGGGGVSLTTVQTNGTVDPGQKGGDSKFTDQAGTIPEIVLATGGAGGLNARVASNTAITQLGGDGSSAGSIGDVGAIFRGGNGGDAGSSGGGGGGGAGDSADAADVGVSITAGLGGSLGGGAGSGGRGNGGVNQPASAGSSPGGGGGGVKISSTNASNLGGAGGAGMVKLTYTFSSGLEKFAVVADPLQTVGIAFDVTITAQNASNTTVNDSTSVVTMNSPSGSLMEFDWNSDGIYGDNSGTLMSGVKTIKARNRKAEIKNIIASHLGVTTEIPAGIETAAGAFAKLQILSPGVTAAPGTDSGQTGTPSNRGAGNAFNVTVNAVDEFWNIVSAVTDTVAITSTDMSATLPANAALVASTSSFSVTMNSLGTFTLTATNVTDANKTAHTTQDIPVISTTLTWDAGNTSNGATIDSASGTWDTTAGNVVWNGGFSNLPWSPANDAVFGGVDAISPAAYDVAVGASFSAQRIRFESSGYKLSASSAQTITITLPNTGLSVISGKTATIGTNLSVIGSTTYFIGAPTSSGAGGTLNIEGAGATVRTASPSNSLQIQGNGTVVNVKAGGFLGTGVGNGGGSVSVGVGTGSQARLNVDGGSVNVQGSNAGGSFNVGADNQATVTLSNEGSIIVNPAKTNGVTFGSGAGNAATNTFHLDGGTLTTRIVRKGSATSTAIFNFNGGTLRANTANTAFMTGLDQANVKSHGAIIDSNGVNVIIGQNLLDGTGGGGLTKSGLGTLTLTGSNTYNGPTTVSAGTLALVDGSHASAISVGSGAGLRFTLGSPTTSTAAVTLTSGIVSVTGAVDGTTSYKLMTAASFTGPFVLSPLIANYMLETRAGGTELWLSLVPADPFTAWAGAGVNFNDDTNNDGVSNGLAWLLGAANPNADATSLMPVVTQAGGNLKISFDMLPAAARGSAQLFVEHSSDLSTWSTGVMVPEATGGTAPVTFTVSGTSLLDVEATVSSSAAAAGKLFGRLRVVK